MKAYVFFMDNERNQVKEAKYSSFDMECEEVRDGRFVHACLDYCVITYGDTSS